MDNARNRANSARDNADIDKVKELIDRILADQRIRNSSHFSDRVFTDEPILTTGRQMRNYLPDEYRAMKKISRWSVDPATGKGRWLSENELFFRQGMAIADLEDDYPYHGTLRLLYPTYNDLSDQQLRGYVSWRTKARRGSIAETEPGFVSMYMSELVNGIGIDEPLEGACQLRELARTFEHIDPSISRAARNLYLDYVVYHGLDRSLLNDLPWVAFDSNLATLKRVTEALAPSGTLRKGESALALPPDVSSEETLFGALCALSGEDFTSDPIAIEHAGGLRHVLGSVYLRLVDHYSKHCKQGLIDTLFGSITTMSYTMFRSTLFFEEKPHPDAEYSVDDLRRYTCKNGFWTASRAYGSTNSSSALAKLLAPAATALARAYGAAEDTDVSTAPKVPKYLAKIIDNEVDVWVAWEKSHTPRHIEIDLSALSNIRSTAAVTREALLIDEERADIAETSKQPPVCSEKFDAAAATTPEAQTPSAPKTQIPPVSKTQIPPVSKTQTPSVPTTVPVDVDNARQDPFSTEQRQYLAALLDNDAEKAQAVLDAAGTSEDILVDVINEAAFDIVGDTIIEFTSQGPAIIPDYEQDVRGLIDYD